MKSILIRAQIENLTNFLNKKKLNIQINRTILENFSYLTILQIVSLILPLLTYPYLIRVLGIQIYGKIIFAQIIATNLGLIINFGYNISGTKEIAKSRADNHELSKIVSVIYSVKFVIWLLCLLAFTICIFSVPQLRQSWLLFFISYFITLGDLLFPIWFFQGIEKMRYVSIINISVKLITSAFVFVAVKEKIDYLAVPILNVCSALMSGVIAIQILRKKEKIIFSRQSLTVLFVSLKQGFTIFVSMLSIQIYVNATKMLIGAFLGSADLAIYDLAEKINTVLKIPIMMISQATFPQISRQKNISAINKFMVHTATYALLAVAFIYLCGEEIITFVLFNSNTEAITITKIMGFSSVLIAFNIFLGSNRLLPFDYEAVFLRNTLFSCVFFVVSFGVLISLNLVNLYSVSYLTLATELFTLIISLYSLYKLKLMF